MTEIGHRDTEDTETQRKRGQYLCAFVLLCTFALTARETRGEERISFKRDIAPMLLNNCLACHGPGTKKAGNGSGLHTSNGG